MSLIKKCDKCGASEPKAHFTWGEFQRNIGSDTLQFSEKKHHVCDKCIVSTIEAVYCGCGGGEIGYPATKYFVQEVLLKLIDDVAVTEKQYSMSVDTIDVPKIVIRQGNELQAEIINCIDGLFIGYRYSLSNKWIMVKKLMATSELMSIDMFTVSKAHKAEIDLKADFTSGNVYEIF